MRFKNILALGGLVLLGAGCSQVVLEQESVGEESPWDGNWVMVSEVLSLSDSEASNDVTNKLVRIEGSTFTEYYDALVNIDGCSSKGEIKAEFVVDDEASAHVEGLNIVSEPQVICDQEKEYILPRSLTEVDWVLLLNEDEITAKAIYGPVTATQILKRQ